MASRYTPRRKNPLDSAIGVVSLIAQGSLKQYPQMNLKLAGIEGNASKYGYTEVKNIISKLVENIRNVAYQYGIKSHRRIENVELPPQVLQEIQRYASEALAQLEALKTKGTVSSAVVKV